ncbi:MAG: DUF1501 domain-containing protein [Planctomycetaceae bacterium]|nr:DUF1501 domain-containing protein [Planctomycetaceae bacterium]
MFDVGSFRSRECQGVSRRSLLRFGAGLPLLAAAGQRKMISAAGPVGPARSVLLLWLWGGPSHLDTFDPKPLAPQEIRGPFSTLSTRTSGLRVTELFPRLAARSDRFSIVRSHKNHTAVHRVAGSITLSGGKGETGDDNYGPTVGSIVQKQRTRNADLPPFVSVTPGPLKTALGVVKGAGGGRWGKAFDPVAVRCSDTGRVDIPALKLLEGLKPERLSDRRLLLGLLDQATARADDARSATWSDNFRRAYRLLISPEGRRAFDLSRESAATRGRYGRSVFGQSCLLARRLVEAEVPFVQVNWSQYVENLYGNRTDFGWDLHWLNFEHMTDRHGPILDRALSALLDDLRDRGLLDQTLVIAIGEFGRTPKISANGGRDHWPAVYSSLWAGGGVIPGRVIGRSDERAYDSVTAPVTPDMVVTTILQQAGIGAEDRVRLRVFEESQVIEGLVS